MTPPPPPQTLSYKVGVFGYQQWLKSVPGGYVFRERNLKKTGKWSVIETIPEIPEPTLHQSFSWHKPAFHDWSLLLRMLMPSSIHLQKCCFIDGVLCSMCSEAVITLPLGIKALNSGHCVTSDTHGWALEDRLRQTYATKPQAIFKIVPVRLKLFPLRLSCGAVWLE